LAIGQLSVYQHLARVAKVSFAKLWMTSNLRVLIGQRPRPRNNGRSPAVLKIAERRYLRSKSSCKNQQAQMAVGSESATVENTDWLSAFEREVASPKRWHDWLRAFAIPDS